MRGRNQLSDTGAGGGQPAQAVTASGRFLELSVPAADVPASIAFYVRLGFALAEVGEAWRHPYAVMTDGRVSIGLHRLDGFAPTLTFVKADLLRHLELIERLGVEFDVRRLGADVFNELGWRDPCGNALRFVEARTFSPVKRPPSARPHCGDFREIALPAADLAACKTHWEAIGFVGLEEQGGLGAHVGCTSDTVDVGLYDAAGLTRPTLVFAVDDLENAAAALAAAGLEPPALALPGPPASLALTAPEGTPIRIVRDA